ncbi:MAG: DUF2288 domain-containing protein [Verrucomicrobiales bacterium]|nr:DUF2288 domain-containing protein [Verrucomicrobiota bacterium JB025]
MTPPDHTQPEPMKYSILGGTDDLSTSEKLSQYTGTVDWSYLAPHCSNGSLYFVDPELELTRVGAAFAENQTDQVKAWLKSGDLVQIGDLHARQWQDTDTRFEALVVSPFVLFRPL